jgi:hypothetical protein
MAHFRGAFPLGLQIKKHLAQLHTGLVVLGALLVYMEAFLEPGRRLFTAGDNAGSGGQATMFLPADFPIPALVRAASTMCGP